MKAVVKREIGELVDDVFIVHSTSPMFSPLLCELMGMGGKGRIRIAVGCDYM